MASFDLTTAASPGKRSRACFGKTPDVRKIDTGPLHLAAAAGTASVGIFWCGNLVTAALMYCARHGVQVSSRIDGPRSAVKAARLGRPLRA